MTASSPLEHPVVLARIPASAGSPYSVIFVDAAGFPVIPLTAWYHLRSTLGPDTTRQTYTSCLIPIIRYLISRGVAWNSHPEQLRETFFDYFTDHLRCQMQPRLTREGTLDHTQVVATAQTPISASSIRVICAALRDWYTVLISAKLYGYTNPMTSEVRAALAHLQQHHITNHGAPDIAGIRSEEHRRGVRQQSALLTHTRAGMWHPDPLRMRDAVLEGIHRDLHAMAVYIPARLLDRDLVTHSTGKRSDQQHYARILRDRAVLLLLQYTGARVHEITGMTVGGYRAGGQDGWVLLVNKGSGGIATKVIGFAGTPAFHALQAYLTHGRPWLSGTSQPLATLPDAAPIFVTQRGTAYTTKAFEAQWRRLLAAVQRQCPLHFTPHDVRHWFVTRYLLHAKVQSTRNGTSYTDAKATFSRVMAWSNPQTIETYDHSLDQVEGWGAVAAFQREITHPLAVDKPVTESDVSPPPLAAVSLPLISEEDLADQGLTAEELAWLDTQIECRERP